MPIAPPTRCSAPECYELTTEGRCEQHQRKAWANRSKAWGAGSTRKWRAFRDAHIASACRWCGKESDLQLDHIIPLSLGGSKWDPANVQTLCSGCHDVKSAQDRRDRTREGGSRLRF